MIAKKMMNQWQITIKINKQKKLKIVTKKQIIKMKKRTKKVEREKPKIKKKVKKKINVKIKKISKSVCKTK